MLYKKKRLKKKDTISVVCKKLSNKEIREKKKIRKKNALTIISQVKPSNDLPFFFQSFIPCYRYANIAAPQAYELTSSKFSIY
jgi:hypothetical protein